MKPVKKLIQFIPLLFLLTIPLQAICRNVTEGDTVTKTKAFSFDILPEIERDLKVCDQVKVQNTELNQRVFILESEKAGAIAERDQARSEAKKEKRKRIWGNVIRTGIEVLAIIAIVKL
jgi:hypothetical protein